MTNTNMIELPTQERLKELFEYREDGELIRKTNVGKKVKIGDVAGSITSDGYKAVKIGYKNYKLHRLIWAWHNGTIPAGFLVDHISGDNNDNRIGNLQLLTNQQNIMKQKLITVNNTSGYRCVSWRKDCNKWEAHIKFNGKKTHLGLFTDVEEAARAYDIKAIECFGEHANLNFGQEIILSFAAKKRANPQDFVRLNEEFNPNFTPFSLADTIAKAQQRKDAQ